MIESFAYSGTGDVHMLQQLLRVCGDKIYKEEDDDEDEEKKATPSTASSSSSSSTSSTGATGTVTAGAPSSSSSSSSSTGTSTMTDTDSSSASAPTNAPNITGILHHLHQGSSVIGLAAVAMGEQLASQMSMRSMDHLLQYGEVNIRRAVPLALALLSISNPQLTVTDTLTKLAHDQDLNISQNAVLALGLIGAGTNNSRIAHILRGLAAYFSKEPAHLFLGTLHSHILSPFPPIHRLSLLLYSILFLLYIICDLYYYYLFISIFCGCIAVFSVFIRFVCYLLASLFFFVFFAVFSVCIIYVVI